MGLKLEEILSNGKYRKNDTQLADNNNEEVIWSISGNKAEEEKVYTYDEAIELTGNGWYNISLLITLALAIQAMSFDMFGFAYVVPAAACDMQLSHNQASFLLCVPLIGAVVSAYLHGYISDMYGRKIGLSVILWGSFLIASLSALSPNFTVLAILKCLSSSMCSGVQSMATTLMGESCSVHKKGRYMLILSSSLVWVLAVFTVSAYLVLPLELAYDLGFIIFKPWRLLILILAVNLGFSAVILGFFYESPKFLVNAGRTAEALEILKQIKKRNRGDDNYPVKKIILLENNSIQRNDVSFLRSLWDQTAPLFTPPLLQRTLLLFYIVAVIYSVNNGFFLWIPILSRSFFEESSTITGNITKNFCSLLHSNQAPTRSDYCSAAITFETVLMGVTQGLTFLTINFVIAMLAHKKKILIIFISNISSFSCFAMLLVTEKVVILVLFFGVLTNSFTMGIVFCYFVELYPTRYRGMISSLGVMVARISGMAGVNLVGAYMFTHCTVSLCAWGSYVFSCALIALLLPSDTLKKS